MSRRNKKRAAAPRGGWRRLALAALCLAVLAGAGWGLRIALLPGATAQPAAPAPPASAAPPAAVAATGDYTRRVVAYVYESEPVTRAELGEYLIARRGPEKLGVMVNRGIIEQACRERAIEVTAGEVESALNESTQGLNMDRAAFQKHLQARYHMNLVEWKEEVLRPRLLLTKLCRDQVRVSAEELQQAFEAGYGEKFDGRIILYPNTPQGQQQALAEYNTVRSSAEAFEQAAKKQYRSELAGCAGRIKPFGRYEMEDPELDRVAFALRPGEVSQVVGTKQGPVVLWCLERRPPDSSVRFEDVRPKLLKDLVEKKVSEKMKEETKKLKDHATPRLLLTRKDSGYAPVMPEGSGEPNPGQVVAWYNNTVPITREELGEYLITCFGEESVEFMVNRRIIDKECGALGIQVSDLEIRTALGDDLQKLGASVNMPDLKLETFVKDFLGQYKKTLYEYIEDAVRPRLMLEKLCRNRVQVTDGDLRMAFEAYYGEKLECRMILWPPDQIKFALSEYPRIRDSEEAFAQAAKQQASPSLAANGGRLPRFGRWSLDNRQAEAGANVEAEAFKLQPGEVSSLIGTPQGHVVIKCDRRIPPETGVTLEQVRPKLEKDVRARKVQMEMGGVFKELWARAHPQILLRDPSRPLNVPEETSRVLSDLPAEERARLHLPAAASPSPAH